MAQAALDECLSRCISTYLQPCVPGETLEEVLRVVSNPLLYPKDLVPAVIDNQAYSQFIIRTDFLQTRIKEWIAESPDGTSINYRMILERVFTLLGRQASRNLVACIRLNRLMGQIPKKKQDRMPVQPKEQLKFALAAEEFCESHSFAFTEHAFVGGLHYDFLNGILTRTKAPKDAINQLPNQWAESKKAAHIAYEIGALLKSFKFNDWVFAAALSIGIGKVLMQTLFPKDLGAGSWVGLMSEAEKLKWGKWIFIDLQEKKRFPVTHAELASLFASYMHALRPVSKAIALYQNPYVLKERAPDQSTLANILCLSQALAENRNFDLRHERALRNIGLKSPQIAELMKKVEARR